MIVMRRCCFTHQLLERKDLYRVVRNKEGKVNIDLSYKAEGRGAYILKDVDVISKAKKKDTLSKALRHKVDQVVYDELITLAKGE